jgi:hypothetical protein
MASPTPLSERSPKARFALAVAVPFVFGAVVGVFLGISTGAYWALSALAALGGVLAGFEHPDWRSGARRVALGGALYGLGLLLAHAVAGTDAKVSLGSFPPLLIVIDALIGGMLGALGGRLGSGRAARSS